MIKRGNKMPKVSVIIPVYNVEKYLEECLQSVCKQTLKEIEIICINDGSTDNSRQILKDFAKKDKRIVLIEQENRGVSIARNNGLRAAKGKYIAFVDSDDMVEPDFFEKLYLAAEKYNVDIAAGGYKSMNQKGKIKTTSKFSKTGKITDATKRLEALLYIAYIWNKLYKKELIINNQIYFPEHRTYEDMFWTPAVAIKAQSVCTVPNTFYIYRYNENSITNTTLIDEQKHKNLKEGTQFLKNFLVQNHLNLHKRILLKSKTKISLFGIKIFQIKNYENMWEFYVLGILVLKGQTKTI